MPTIRYLFAVGLVLAGGPVASQPQTPDGKMGEYRGDRTARSLRGSEAARLIVRMVEQQLLTIPGVRSIHDLHVRTSKSGVDAVSAHLVVTNMEEAPRIMKDARRLVVSEFDTRHVTIQVEREFLRNNENMRNI